MHGEEKDRRTALKRVRQSGQVMIFLIMILVVLTLAALWNFDLQKLLNVKSTAQHAGDAAALTAARWQALSLNLAGDLNLMQMIALSEADSDTVVAISNLQARLRFSGPMTAMMAAQQAAKNNRLHVHPDYTAFFFEHADRVGNQYAMSVGADGDILFPEPYEGAWDDYRRMLRTLAENGIAAAPDNMRLFTDTTGGGHLLHEIGFYEAIAGRNWCWFFFHAPSLLESYQNFFPAWWAALPEVEPETFDNSEFFGLDLAWTVRPLTSFGLTGTVALATMAEQRAWEGTMVDNVLTQSVAWVTYGSRWGTWDQASTQGEDPFPFSGRVRPVYDVAGADAAVRVEAVAHRLSPGAGGATVSNRVVWSAAAKPFGSFDRDRPVTAFQLVLPAFHDVRLIPVDASSAPAAGGFNLEWRHHVERHLTDYMNHGPYGLPSSCFYCHQLRTWEDEAFRQSGSLWLTLYSDRCRPSGGPGPGSRGGGRRRGH